MAKNLQSTTSVKKGSKFEDLAQNFLKRIFAELGFTILHCRRQKSGTQYGFDILVIFLDDLGKQRDFYFECKNYTTTLDYKELLLKMHDLQSIKAKIDGFIAISPHENVSNIEMNVHENVGPLFKFPVRLWTPESYIKEYFALDDEIHKKVYKKSPSSIDRHTVCKKLKAVITTMLQEKDCYEFASQIEINDAVRDPAENENLRTTLDDKFNSLMAEDDPRRLEYHKQRCDYKVFLEDLEDTNTSLRQSLVRWQNDMKVKAIRLTHHFTDETTYSPQTFFRDFFSAAEQDLLIFIEDEAITGDKQKLLHGVVFELAAECFLNWRK